MRNMMMRLFDALRAKLPCLLRLHLHISLFNLLLHIYSSTSDEIEIAHNRHFDMAGCMAMR